MKRFSSFQVCFSLISFSFLSLCAGTSSAQNVDFELPTEINVVQGRLSVAFNDGVNEQEAQALIESLGYSVLQTNFKPLLASAFTDKPLPEKQLSALRSNPLIQEIYESDLQAVQDNQVRSTLSERRKSRYQTSVRFQPYISGAEALRILSESTNTAFNLVARPANEIIIDVGDEDEIAFTQLDGHVKVKWVTYVGVAGF